MTRLPSPRPSRGLLCIYVASGLSALVWFLVRVVPKPSRAAYPCQRVALPLASSFLGWVAGLAGTVIAFRRARACLRRARHAAAAACAAAGIAAACFTLSLPGEPAAAAWIPSDPPNAPIGEAKGIHPGRVVWVHDPDATDWDGASNYWWSDANTDPPAVEAMLAKGLRALTGAPDDAAAWDAIFRHFNRTHGRGDVGYREGEGIAIKINMNVAGDYAATNEPIVSPQVVRALLGQLVREAGVTEAAISVYDASRSIPAAIYDPCHGAFPEVRFVDNDGAGGRDAATPDPTVPVHYDDPRVGASGTTRLPRCVVGASYLINLALLRGHSLAGVTLCAKNHFGSVWRPDTTSDRGFKPSNIHISIDRNANPMGAPNALVDLMGHEHLGGKTLLFFIDALYAAVNQGSARPTRWRSDPFDDDWTSSLFLSQDGVAIDSVALDFCRSEPTLAGQVTGRSVDNYLHEAALAADPPSGTFYDPEGDGTRLSSLGVHEHWNNAAEKRYSRNLGTGEGIELLVVSKGRGFRRGDANADGSLDIGDAIVALSYLFAGGREPSCLSTADANDTGDLDISDPVSLLEYLFAGGDPPPAPFADCGADPTPDALSCASFPPCRGGATVKLVSAESPARILVPRDGALGLAWTRPDFDDATWIRGEAAVGYDENDTYRSHFTTDLGARMNGVNPSAYIRIPFAVDEARPIDRLTLWMKFDDGFIAYLNGTRAGERNAPASASWDATATGSHSDSQAVVFEGFDISGAAGRIAVGGNVLAIHGLNVGLDSSDFLIVAELEARMP